ncbi:FAD-dependent oxidoreductase [Petrachloros mirabilis]
MANAISLSRDESPSVEPAAGLHAASATQKSAKTIIVIVGGGFAGIETARRIGRLAKKNDAVDVILVSSENYFLFQPLLPEVVAGNIEPTHILNPIRQLCQQIRYRWGTVEAIDLRTQQLTLVGADTTKPQRLFYDHLILCLGQVIGSSKVPGMNEHALSLKTLGDAFELRNHILSRLEEAEITDDDEVRRKLLTFVTIGGGFSGVETAAAINDLVYDVSAFYPKARTTGYRSILIHSGDRILGELDADLAEFAKKKLEGRGVEIRIKMRVCEVTRDKVVIGNGEAILTGSVISTVGNVPHPLVGKLELPQEGGRILVDEFLRVRGFRNLWALGDAASVPDLPKGGVCPPTAQYAVRQGKQCARNVLAAIRGAAPASFRYKGRGQMAVVGKHCGIAQIGRWKLSGVGAWLLWRTVYFMKLPGLRCRVRVAFDWLLDFLFPRDLTKVEVHRTDVLPRAHYTEGEVIVQQGDVADCFYLIEAGEVEIVKETPGRAPERLRVCSAGDTFGEVGILNNAPRTATVRCLTAVDVMKFGRHNFLSMFQGYRSFRSQVQEGMQKYHAECERGSLQK